MSPSGLIFQQELDKWKASTAPIVRLYKKVECLRGFSSLHANNSSESPSNFWKAARGSRRQEELGYHKNEIDLQCKTPQPKAPFLEIFTVLIEDHD